MEDKKLFCIFTYTQPIMKNVKLNKNNLRAREFRSKRPVGRQFINNENHMRVWRTVIFPGYNPYMERYAVSDSAKCIMTGQIWPCEPIYCYIDIVCHTEHEIIEARRLRLEKEKPGEFQSAESPPPPNYDQLLLENTQKLTLYHKLFSGLKSLGL